MTGCGGILSTTKQLAALATEDKDVNLSAAVDVMAEERA